MNQQDLVHIRVTCAQDVCAHVCCSEGLRSIQEGNRAVILTAAPWALLKLPLLPDSAISLLTRIYGTWGPDSGQRGKSGSWEHLRGHIRSQQALIVFSQGQQKDSPCAGEDSCLTSWASLLGNRQSLERVMEVGWQGKSGFSKVERKVLSC